MILWQLFCGVSLINLTSQIHAANFMLKLRRPTNYCGGSLVNLTPSDTWFKFHAKFKTAHKLLWRLLSQYVMSKKKPNLRLVSLCLWRFAFHCWFPTPGRSGNEKKTYMRELRPKIFRKAVGPIRPESAKNWLTRNHNLALLEPLRFSS